MEKEPTRDVRVSASTWAELVRRKIGGEFRSLDAVLRDLLGLPPKPTARLRTWSGKRDRDVVRPKQ